MNREKKASKEAKSIKMHFFNSSWFTKDGELDWRQIVSKTLILIMFFLLVYTIGFYLLRHQYHEIGAWVATHLSLFEVGLFVFLMDLFIVPLSVDIIFPFAFSFPMVKFLLVTGIASACAGYGGYWIGRWLGKIKLIQRLTSHFNADGEQLIHKFGAWGVVIAGITPIPFSTVCWITGMLRVPHWQVALASLSRLVRMATYYWIFLGGLSVIF